MRRLKPSRRQPDGCGGSSASRFHTLDFELGQAEARAFDLLEQVPNAIDLDLDRVRLGPAGEVTVLNVHYQIAQKIHACTEIPAEGDNPRVHDLYDILLLADLAERDGLAVTRIACEDTFTHRVRHAWPPELPEWDAWPQIWDALDIPGAWIEATGSHG